MKFHASEGLHTYLGVTRKRYAIFLTYRNGEHQQIKSAGTFGSKAAAERMARLLSDVFKEADSKS